MPIGMGMCHPCIMMRSSPHSMENKALKEKSFKTTQVDTAAPIENMEKSFKQERMIEDMDKDDIDEKESAEVEEVLEVLKAAKLMTKVVTTTQPTTTAALVPKASAPRRRRGQALIDMDEAFARQLEAKLNANINWIDVIEQVKRSKRQDNTMIRPFFEKIYNSIQAFLMKVKEEVTLQEEGNKRQGESLKQETTKKQRMDEEVEELKRHLEIVANDDDDVFTEATPLASKVPVIDYQIHHENNKPYYKIIRADGTHKLFLSFITLLKNFDKEDLKALWKLVKE
nr:hypothetical protein [Tanacetum cinerariifolium]